MDALASLATVLLCPTIVITLGYLGLCAATPYTRCRRCHGAGFTKAMLGRRRPCRHCRTSGLRLRIGVRITNHLRRLNHAASKPTPTRDHTSGGPR